jgi:bisphosphoglycerate-dependent phosphoglycerate mutase
VPVQHEWRLNERHYGALQGSSKDAAVAEYGLVQVRAWRRGFLSRPPAQRNRPAADRRYSHPSVVRGGEGVEVRVPESESLHDARERMKPWMEQELWPTMRAAIESARRDVERGGQAAKQVGVEGGAGGRRRAAAGQMERAAVNVNDDAVNDDAVNDDAVNCAPAGASGDGRLGGASTGAGASMGASVDVPSPGKENAPADWSGGGGSAPVPEVPVFVISSSHNMLRAILMEIEGLTPEQVEKLNVPYSIPLTLQFDQTLTPIATPWAQAPLRRGWYVGDPNRVASVQGEIDEDLATAEQQTPETAPVPELTDEAPPAVRRIC